MLKAIFVILFIIGGLVIPINAQSTSDFGYKLHPEKLLENTIGDLQIYEISNSIMVPKSIKNLKVVSSDIDIIQILESQEDTGSFTKNIKIKAVKPGIATIALAAQGFSSKEITLQVFNNNNYPTQIMMKATPMEFSIDGQKYGYLGIELVTTGGLPTVALEDVVVKIETPNTDVVQIRDSVITIKKGEYFGITEFDIVGSGSAVIFADTEGMRKISDIITVLEPEGPLKIQLTVIPEIYNSFSGAEGYAIIQLVDAGGIPVIAEEDIYFELDVDNPNVSKNSSTDFDEIIFGERKLVIKKGEYTTFTKFSPIPNLAYYVDVIQQEYNMFISVQDYQARGATFMVLHDEIGSKEGEGPAVTVMLSLIHI